MRGKFFKRLDDPLVLGGMPRPCADVRKAELLEKLSDVALVERDAEPLGDDALEVHSTPTYDAVYLSIRSGLDDRRELGHLLNRQARLGTLSPVVEESIRPGDVEPMDPVAQRLPVHAADLGRRSAIHSVPNRSQRQKPSALVDVLRPPGQRLQLLSRIVLSQLHR